jgi:anti-anti-sigma regulatory factor
MANLRYIGDVAVVSFDAAKLSDMDYAAKMPEYADQVVVEKKKCLVFDFSKIDYIPSITVGYIMNAYLTLKEANLGFYLCNLEKTPRRIFDLALGKTGIPIEDNLDTIVAQYRKV